jgi:hypothetical protein
MFALLQTQSNQTNSEYASQQRPIKYLESIAITLYARNCQAPVTRSTFGCDAWTMCLFFCTRKKTKNFCVARLQISVQAPVEGRGKAFTEAGDP